MTREKWTITGQAVDTKILLMLTVLNPIVFSLYLWYQGNLRETYWAVILLTALPLFWWLVFRFVFKQRDRTLTIEGSSLEIETKAGREILDIVKNRVRLEVRVSRGRGSGFPVYDLHYWKQRKGPQTIRLGGFATKELQRLDLYLGQFSYDPSVSKAISGFVLNRKRAFWNFFSLSIWKNLALCLLLYFLLNPVRKAILTMDDAEVGFYFLMGGLGLFLILRNYLQLPKTFEIREDGFFINGEEIAFDEVAEARWRGLDRESRQTKHLTLVLKTGEKRQYYLGVTALMMTGKERSLSLPLALDQYFRGLYYQGKLAQVSLSLM